MTFYLHVSTAKGRAFELERNSRYGADKRTGWSVAVDDSYAAQLVPLRSALWAGAKAVWRRWRGRP